MKNSNRRGVLLLVVLALLAMFAMVAVAFVVLAGSEKRSADRVRATGAVDESPEKTLNQAFNVVVRGPYIAVNPTAGTLAATTSAITWQSLLEKIYGYETIGSLTSPATMANSANSASNPPFAPMAVCNGQLIEFTLPTAPPDTTTISTITIDPFRYVGCVVTMLTGQAAGLSSRIVGVNPLNYNVQMAAFESGILPAVNDQYIVNGFPYSGMGFGFSTTGGGLNAPAPGLLVASSTISLALTPNAPPGNWGAANRTAIIPGGVNSDYTAADYQDPLPALAVPDPSNNGGILVPIPSLHRADLIAYCAKQAGISSPQVQSNWGAANVGLLRQVMFRPNSIDHPLFTGSNPNFNPVWDGITPGGGRWDVDNDGDGIPDSVWVDLGLPVRFAPDGQAYKPLVAILCLDLDGRLNLNAHGSYAQTQQAYYSTMNLQSYAPLSSPPGSAANLDIGIGAGTTAASSAAAYYFASLAGSSITVSPIVLPRGQGTGTAEVNLLPLFRKSPGGSFSWSSANANTNYQALLSGGTVMLPSGGTMAVMGRYGPGIGSALPGINGPGSALTFNNAFPYSGVVGGNNNYWTNFAVLGSNYNYTGGSCDAFGSPPDTQTIGAVALDRAGRPLYISLGGPVANSPYDLDLTRNAPHAVDQAYVNNPFGVAELERILRCYDRDAATLPQRLANLTLSGSGANLTISGSASLLQSRRAEVTTESAWVPCASGVLPPCLRFTSSGQPLLANMRSLHPVDLLAAKIAQCGGNAANLNLLRMQLLPPEILKGLKMDLNRPFGTGAYSMLPGNGTVSQNRTTTVPDQPGTSSGQIPQFLCNSPGSSPPWAAGAVNYNYSADGGTLATLSASATDSFTARQLYARHLYVLALALSDTAAILTDLQAANASATSDDVTRLIAQWAVNVVAYRDHNSVMIPFVYDPNPFSGNGWGPSVSPATYNVPQYTVWGCKRPELLITETLAFHDRRTQDRKDEVLDNTKLQLYGIKTYSRTAAGFIGAASTSGSKDCGFNSAYRPQGSLFVELNNPWTINEPRMTDLGGVDPVSRVAGVQLNKVTPPDGNGQSSPVWRLVIVDPSQNAPPTTPGATNGDELPDPDNPFVARRPTIERAAYFACLNGLTYPTGDGKVIFGPSTTNPSGGTNSVALVVAPSGYAVVGSGDPNQGYRTYIGFETSSGSTNFATSRVLTLSQTDLTTADPRVLRNSGGTPPTAPVPKVLGIDYNWSNSSFQRLSVSEPTQGYAAFERDANGNLVTIVNASTGQYNETLDIPVDQQRCNTIVSKANPNPPAAGETFAGTSLWTLLNTNGTVPAFRIVYLQRLADPTRTYVADNSGTNPQLWNPYRTVDAMTVDLTTFNGVPPVTGGATTDPTSPSKGNWNGHFEAHQRGEKSYLPNAAPATAGSPTEVNLWKQEPALKATPSPLPAASTTVWTPVGWTGGGLAGTATMYFNQPLNQTLGYLNQSFGTAASAPTGDPQYPFPWLNFPYRPFNNEYELLLVPALSSSKLLARNTLDARRYFGYVDDYVRNVTNSGGNYQPQPVYGPPTSSPAAPFNGLPYSAQVPYPHLLNFFESTQSSKSGTGFASQLHRLLAYVGVPSRFANAQLQMRADLAASAAAAHFFHTPFNRISRYREPGRINLNMVTSSDVLFGALNMYLPPLQVNSQLNPAFWDKFVRSRRGDGAVTASSSASQTLTNMLTISASMPSRFMRPYRTPGGEDLVAPPAGNGVATEPPRETEVTLLRSDPDGASRPLFEMDDYLFGGTPNTLASNMSTTATPDKFGTDVATFAPNGLACMDFNRNPYFRYQALQKLGNVFSNHSNVFAIWLTVGYFEALPASNPNATDANGNLIYPDGYQLGQELGSDSGNIVRHRSFYIFDRSIPVGFIRGRDINHDKAVLLKRFTE